MFTDFAMVLILVGKSNMLRMHEGTLVFSEKIFRFVTAIYPIKCITYILILVLCEESCITFGKPQKKFSSLVVTFFSETFFFELQKKFFFKFSINCSENFDDIWKL